MTDKTEKQNIAFYIFEKGTNGNGKRVGTAFKHNKGNGLNILMDKKRYVAFPPKAKQEEGEEA